MVDAFDCILRWDFKSCFNDYEYSYELSKITGSYNVTIIISFQNIYIIDYCWGVIKKIGHDKVLDKN